MDESTKLQRIAILGSHISWDGGVDFLCYLVQSIQSAENNKLLKLYLILPHDFISRLKTFVLQLKFAIHQPSLLIDKKTKLFENKNLKLIQGFKVNAIDVEIVYYNYTKNDLIKKLKYIQADILFPSIRSLGGDFPIPWVGYIPDLQHKHFPDNFSKEECLSRDHKYQELLNDSGSLFVNSVEARNDLLTYYTCNDKNVFCLPFCPPAPLIEISEELSQKILQKYKLPEKFFIISNQFWKHKSHITAFKALAELINEGTHDIELICTGKPYDDKDPAFIESLFQQIKTLGIEHKIRFTGFLPKTDQLVIMSKSIALIQPTLFEGGPGGGSVYNAISYGTPCIISDIAINKEVKGNSIYFFKAGDASDLKNRMKELLHITHPTKTFKELTEEGNNRTTALGHSMFAVFKNSMS